MLFAECFTSVQGATISPDQCDILRGACTRPAWDQFKGKWNDVRNFYVAVSHSLPPFPTLVFSYWCALVDDMAGFTLHGSVCHCTLKRKHKYTGQGWCYPQKSRTAAKSSTGFWLGPLASLNWSEPDSGSWGSPFISGTRNRKGMLFEILTSSAFVMIDKGISWSGPCCNWSYSRWQDR